MTEIPQVVQHEADPPDIVAALLDADVLTREDTTQIDLLPTKADAPAARDSDGFVVERIVERVHAPLGCVIFQVTCRSELARSYR